VRKKNIEREVSTTVRRLGNMGNSCSDPCSTRASYSSEFPPKQFHDGMKTLTTTAAAQAQVRRDVHFATFSICISSMRPTTACSVVKDASTVTATNRSLTPTVSRVSGNT
jgi:hypothetical protein